MQSAPISVLLELRVFASLIPFQLCSARKNLVRFTSTHGTLSCVSPAMLGTFAKVALSSPMFSAMYASSNEARPKNEWIATKLDRSSKGNTRHFC